jgi:hypothetical protein
LKKGFSRVDKHHRYYFLHDEEGRITGVYTMLSHSSFDKDVDDYIIAQMSKQCHLDKSLFCKLLDCPLSYCDYLGYLREKEII